MAERVTVQESQNDLALLGFDTALGLEISRWPGQPMPFDEYLFG